jgi:hypothetical protein
MADWPKPFHPVTDGVVDTDETVQIFPLMPEGADALLEWAGGGDSLVVNGGPCVVLPGTRKVRDRVVGLGDVAVADSVGVKSCPGGELAARYTPAGADEAPPAD